MTLLTIGELARQAHVNVETVRYYERRGLLLRPPTSRAGYRRYGGEYLARIRFIKSGQELGFSLKEIDELLSLRVAPETTCADVKARAEAKITDIDVKIRDLRRMRKALASLAASCRGQGPSSECPILEVLDQKEKR
jgi:MerR family mercuric resistance operon transcriptional regulator